MLSDLNEELIGACCAVRDEPKALLDRLAAHACAHSPDHYAAVRASAGGTALDRAARFVYLMRTSWHGLQRLTAAGEFNVPMGDTSGRRIVDRATITAASRALGGASIHAHGFADPAIDPAPGDLIYCDPPYDGTFTAYTAGGFGSPQQEALRDRAAAWAAAGARVVLSNADTPLILDLYEGWETREVRAPRRIAADASRRGAVAELLIAAGPRAE